MSTLRDRIRLSCSDSGQHPEVELALLEWEPDRPADDDGGVRIWEPGEADNMMVENIRENARARRRGGTALLVTRTAADWEDRRRGGRTLVMHCKRCKRDFRLRDDRLDRLRESPVATVDVSLIRW